MIRVSKSSAVPPSLLVPNCNSYDGQDVQQTLVDDQHEKCYLCEQKTTKSFNIEHLKGKAAGFFPELKYTWSNLFLACPYCNGRKPNEYDLLDPTANNIEDIIKHHLDFGNKSIILEMTRVGTKENYTALLLDKMFNGKDKLRDVKGQLLYKDLEREIVFFLQLLADYKAMTNLENKQKVSDSLLITKEFLAFKYWIIKENGFYDDFKTHMTWNRV